MATCPPVIEHIATLADPRGRRGRRHPLGAMVGLAVAATLCGYRSYTAMAEWGRTHGAALGQALGFTREQTPCAATFYHLFRRLEREALEACLGRWQAAVLATLPGATAGVLPALAIDGKTLRGSRKQGAPLTHLGGQSSPGAHARSGGRGREDQRDHGHPRLAGRLAPGGMGGHDGRLAHPAEDRTGPPGRRG
jgi:hypothetical protein